MTDFHGRVDAFLAEFFRLHPTFATAIGEHAYDDRWPDLSEAGRAVRLAFGERWRAEFEAMTELSIDDAIDRDLLLGELDAARFADTELREDAWDPLDWVYVIGDGLFTLNAREFAPLADRLASTAGRLEGLSAVLDAARESLVGHAGRPVSRFHTETALNQAPGIHDLITEALECGRGRSPDRSRRGGRPAALERRGRDVARRPRRVRGPPSRGRPAGERWGGSARRRSCSPPRCATRCAPRR